MCNLQLFTAQATETDIDVSSEAALMASCSGHHVTSGIKIKPSNCKLMDFCTLLPAKT